jgi:hypothetical protein
MVKYIVKKRCFHLGTFEIIKSDWIWMLHIISFHNLSKNAAKVSFNIFKIEYFQTHLTLGSYGAVLKIDVGRNISPLL